MILKFDIFFQLGFSAQFLSVIVLSATQTDVKTGEPKKLSPEEQQDFKNVLIIHLVLSVGACIVLPILAWRGVSYLPLSLIGTHSLLKRVLVPFADFFFDFRLLSNFSSSIKLPILTGALFVLL
jgi:hypothetical protein